MSSELKTNKISPATGTALQIGDSGDTITIPSGATLTNNGSSSGFDAGLASVQTFTSSGTWTRPTGITKVIIEVQGGGGSGNASSTASVISSGAAGGYAKKFLDVSSISTSTITVGSGGASGSGGDQNGTAGGASSWADGTNTVTGSGGAGANSSVSVQAAGGAASGGDINIPGQDSGYGYTTLTGSTTPLGNGTTYYPGSSYVGSGTRDAKGYGGGGSCDTFVFFCFALFAKVTNTGTSCQ